jgi:hypothetical protein
VGYTGPTYATQLGPQMITIKVPFSLTTVVFYFNIEVCVNILIIPDCFLSYAEHDQRTYGPLTLPRHVTDPSLYLLI